MNKIKIGKQVWMTENLNVNTFSNGDPIKQVKNIADWEEAGIRNEPAWCYYNNSSTAGAKYGKLYNWYAIADPRGLAPRGWRLPSKNDFNLLIRHLGEPDNAVIKLKSNNDWFNKGNGTNVSGFNAQPGGYRGSAVGFFDVGVRGYWWTANEHVVVNTKSFVNAFNRFTKTGLKTEADEVFNKEEAKYIGFSYDNNFLSGEINKGSGLAVRCIME